MNICAAPFIGTVAEVGAVCTNKQDGFATWAPWQGCLEYLENRPESCCSAKKGWGPANRAKHVDKTCPAKTLCMFRLAVLCRSDGDFQEFQTWRIAVTAAMGLSVGVLQLAADAMLDICRTHKCLGPLARFWALMALAVRPQLRR